MQSMAKQNKKIRFGLLLAKGAVLGVVAISAAGCILDPNPPPPQGYYSNGAYYSRDDYSSSYSGDYDQFNDDRNDDERNGWGHSDDRNFHNRDDYQQYDR